MQANMSSSASLKSGLNLEAQLSCAAIFLLLLIWQVPGTIGLRNALLGMLFLSVSVWAIRSRFIKTIAAPLQLGPIVVFALLTSWIVVVIMGWSTEPNLSWKEFRGQWLVAAGCGAIGVVAARAALRTEPKAANRLINVIFWALLVQVGAHDIVGAVYWLITGTQPFRQAPVLYVPEMFAALWQGKPIIDVFAGTSPDKFSYVNNTLAAFLVAETVQRLLLHKRWLPYSNGFILLSLAAVFLCSYWLQMRNGNIGLLLLFALAALMVCIRLIKKLGAIKMLLGLALFVTFLGTMGGMMVHSDARWQKLTQSIPIALDTETHRVWLTRDGKYPLMTDGQPVDVSAYERLAWGKEGVKLVVDHPLGSGYNRNAYGDRIDAKYDRQGAYRGGHAHSGVIDFAIANGVPGLLLWLVFLASLFWIGWCAFRGGSVALGLALMFLISGFMGRSLVDSNIRDHVLQQFMFLVGLLYSLASSKQRTP